MPEDFFVFFHSRGEVERLAEICWEADADTLAESFSSVLDQEPDIDPDGCEPVLSVAQMLELRAHIDQTYGPRRKGSS